VPFLDAPSRTRDVVLVWENEVSLPQGVPRGSSGGAETEADFSFERATCALSSALHASAEKREVN
jgi:hypothetical protein